MLFQTFHLATLLILLLVPVARCAAGTAGSDDEQFAYNGFKGANLTLDGASTVTPNGLLMLTNGSIQMIGHAFHPSPLLFREPGAQNATAARSFSTTFVFAVFGPYIDLSTHGLAFVVSSDMAVLSTSLPGQFLGLLNNTDNGNSSTHVFAVELDTLLNADFLDINSNHVGVDVDSLVSRAAADAGYYDDGTGQFRNLSLVEWERSHMSTHSTWNVWPHRGSTRAASPGATSAMHTAQSAAGTPVHTSFLGSAAMAESSMPPPPPWQPPSPRKRSAAGPCRA